MKEIFEKIVLVVDKARLSPIITALDKTVFATPAFSGIATPL